MRDFRHFSSLTLCLIATPTILSNICLLKAQAADVAAHKTTGSVTVQSAEALYSQRQYSSSADAFEILIKTSKPSARLYYFAGLANAGCNRTARAKQLFDYVGTNFSDSQEGINSRKWLTSNSASGETTSNSTVAMATSSKGESTAKDGDEDLPESVKSTMSPEMQALLKTDAGKVMVKQMLAERKDQVKAIKSAECKGVIDKKGAAPVVEAPKVPTKPRALGDNHPFTAADIARDGAGGIDQSRYPNCWFESSMSALARLPRGQKMLADMIRLSPTGGYIVRFPGDGNEYAVTESFLKEHSIHDKATWASIIECAQVRKFPDNAGAQGANEDQSRLEVGMQAITGNKAELLDLRQATSKEISAFIGGATKSDNPIVAGTWPSGWVAQSPPLVVGQHAYTIIGFDPGRELITIRNPHGKNARKFSLPSDPNHLKFEQLDDGVFKISVELFQKLFNQAARSFI